MRLLALLGLALVSVTAWVQETPEQWLHRSAQAERQLAVAGVRVTAFQVGNRHEQVRERFWRRGEQAIRIEVLEPAQFRGDVMIFRNGKWIRYKLGSQEAYEIPFVPGQWADDLIEQAVSLLQAGWLQAVIRSNGTLLGRPTVVIQMQLKRPGGPPPRAEGRTPPRGRKRPFPTRATLWIDRETGLCLKCELELHPGAPLVRSEIVRLDLRPRLTPDLFQLPAGVTVRRLGKNEYASVEEAERVVGFKIRLPEYLPSDAVRERIIAQRRGPRGFQMVAIRYRTPHGNFTLFQSLRPHRGGEFHPPTLPSRENLRAHFWQEGDYWFGIVGNLPQAEIERIARSVR